MLTQHIDNIVKHALNAQISALYTVLISIYVSTETFRTQLKTFLFNCYM